MEKRMAGREGCEMRVLDVRQVSSYCPVTGDQYFNVQTKEICRKPEWRTVKKMFGQGCVWGDTPKPCPTEVEEAIRDHEIH